VPFLFLYCHFREVWGMRRDKIEYPILRISPNELKIAFIFKEMKLECVLELRYTCF
jgi:hypothetical protein